ncbi:MAG: 2Fe-2S iron-sulfur cluster binding domain-containing protein [Roseomonas sp.]|nr:2Fe-2S iron-sulfur cluster binding domain-containing protein [Roseomonas sp.]MCA3328435.1 2Fe-2S iron-sulfur cluster binding domain-containing protein [Roseomonas sp.]MCA3332296.1 2Fe-2S iron-sulfur cluster binding domain-containing protein [Roseomonas sp.]MCA3335683.1 2Fe-2S iron-sulfur cluster binding domain-containing protein [Roseomonas sp.]MCA3346788.1 2Fe-2S iron-sulfur cluster binding domain-containing protein [Roseomonas sp.]
MTQFTLNGAEIALDLPGQATLLQALRGPLGLSSPRYGCGAEQCGSCMVLLDGKPAYACALGVDAVAGRKVVTVEGLGSAAAPHPLQTAFLAEQAGQCGYCLSGILISAAALLAANPDPDEEAIRAAMEPHLCRCGSHNRIIRAIRRAAQEMAA